MIYSESDVDKDFDNLYIFDKLFCNKDFLYVIKKYLVQMGF